MELQDYVQKTYPDDTYRSVFYSLMFSLHSFVCFYSFLFNRFFGLDWQTGANPDASSSTASDELQHN